MPNRPGNDEHTATGGNLGGAAGGLGDRAGHRDASSDNGRPAGVPATANGAASQTGGTPARTRSNRGFASMDRGKQKEIASKGGRAAHAKGTAHEFDSGEAREAGRKGGVAVSRNREHMASIGRRGGEARGHSRARTIAGTNSGATESLDGAIQNSRSSADRQVPITNQNDSASASAPGTRSAAPLGISRPAGTPLDSSNGLTRGEGFGNR